VVLAVNYYYAYLEKAILPESSKFTARIFGETVITKCPSGPVTFKSGPKTKLFAETVAISLQKCLNYRILSGENVHTPARIIQLPFTYFSPYIRYFASLQSRCSFRRPFIRHHLTQKANFISSKTVRKFIALFTFETQLC